VDIEIYADIVCPWCWIGERRLSKALANSDVDATLRWRAFQLDPAAQSNGVPLITYISQRFGGQDKARGMFEHVAGIGAAEGLTMNFDRAISASTLDAHRLIWWAGRDGGDQRPIVDALHQAHFADGVDLGSRDALAENLKTLFPWVPEILHSDLGVTEVELDLAEARSIGISSVPTFIFEGKYAVSGAQEPALFQQVFAQLQ
jgi:predicted DsbA family dithiol-disulfide isomerase